MLTTAHKAALKTHIETSPDLNVFPNDPDGAFAIAALLNALAVPDFYVWRSDVSTEEVRAVLVWSEYDTLSASKQNAFEFLCSNHIVNATLPNVRQGIASIFGAPQQSGNLAALTGVAKRKATRAEKLFATGTGSLASPATMGFEGSISFQDVQDARNS